MKSTLETSLFTSICIFCYKKSDLHHNNLGGKHQTSAFKNHRFFTLIFRYIKRDYQVGMNNRIKLEQLGTLFNCDHLGLCQECGPIVQRFCDLYHQMKFLELRVNWQVDKLWNAMRYADRVPSRILKLKEAERSENGTENYTDTLVCVRQKLKHWCKIHDNNSFPRVAVGTPSPVRVDLSSRENAEPTVALTHILEPPLVLQSFCMFCYKRNKYHGSFYDNQKNVETFLTHLFRHFTNAGKKGQRTVKNQQEEFEIIEQFGLKGKVTMRPCQECEVITEMFCDLYHQMKCVNLQLDWQIEKLGNVMEFADRIPFRVNQFKESVGSNQSKKMLEFRNHLGRSCKTYHNKTLPRVLLSSLSPLTKSVDVNMESESDFNVKSFQQTAPETGEFSEAEITPQIPQHSFLSKSSKQGPSVTQGKDDDNSGKLKRQRALCIHCGKQFNSRKARNSHHKTCSKCRGMMTPRKINPNSVTQQFTKITRNILELEPTPSGIVQTAHSIFEDNIVVLSTNERKCKVCSKQLDKNYQIHLSLCHPEIFFPSSKSSNLSDDQFKAYIRFLLHQQVSECLPLPVDDESGNHWLQCLHCPQHLSRKVAVRVHLLRKHVGILARKLEDLQKKIPPEQATASNAAEKGGNPITRRTSVKKSSKIKCGICAKTYRNPDALKHHKANLHPETCFVSCKFPTITIDQFKTHVAHCIIQEMDNFERSASKTRGKIELQCPHCHKRLSAKKYAQCHLVGIHWNILGKKLNELQQRTMSEEVVKGPKLCTFCGKQFSRCDSYYVHRKICTKRPRDTVAYQRRKATSAKNSAADEWQCNECSALFSTKRSMQFHMEQKHTKSWTCSICSKSYGRYYTLLQHKITCHVESFFIESKLKFVSEDQFKRYVVYLINKTVTSFSIQIDNHQESKTDKKAIKYECKFCSQQIWTRQNTTVHLVLQHGKILEEDLRKLQQTLKPGEIPKVTTLIRSSSLERHTCKTCKNKLCNRRALKEHEIFIHPETYFASSKKSHLSDEVYKKCVTNFLKQGVTSSFQYETDDENNAKLKCAHCKKQFLDKNKARMHFVLTHGDILAKKLEELQENMMLEDDDPLSKSDNIIDKSIEPEELKSVRRSSSQFTPGTPNLSPSGISDSKDDIGDDKLSAEASAQQHNSCDGSDLFECTDEFMSSECHHESEIKFSTQAGVTVPTNDTTVLATQAVSSESPSNSTAIPTTLSIDRENLFECTEEFITHGHHDYSEIKIKVNLSSEDVHEDEEGKQADFFTQMILPD